MPVSKSKQAKFRPVFNADEIKYLDLILKQAYLDHLSKQPYNPDEPNNPGRGYSPVEHDYLIHLMAKIGKERLKIDHQIASPAYVTKGRETLEESLGMDVPEPVATQEHLSKETYWLQCYQKYLTDPRSCSPAEIDGANEHKYLNGLMSDTELEAFENNMFKENS